ncbi:MAG: 30S ribosomal protein S15 [uncultured bacterium]|nr:MAG: 30S ribosomal protein S15 [uncultured bacterium]
MTIDKKEIISKFSAHEGDTGSTSVQIGLLTSRITHLTAHLNLHKKDFSSRRSLIQMAGKRRKLLKYLNRTSPTEYVKITEELNIRKVD